MVGRNDPLYLKFWAKLTPFEQKRRFLMDIRSKRLLTPSEKVQLTLIGRGGLMVGRPTAVREDPSSNLTAAGRV